MEILGEPVISVCPECGGRNIIQDLESGEMVCGGCGLVIAEPAVNTEPEWRAFTKSEYETRSRVGLPSSFSIHDKGLSTMIGPVSLMACARFLSSELLTMHLVCHLLSRSIRGLASCGILLPWPSL